MKTRLFLGIVLCLSLLALVVGLGQAQKPEWTETPATEQGVESEGAVQPEATVTAEWRQRLGQDGQDNYRVQRRPSSTGSWVTLLTLTNVGDMTLKGNKLALGGSANTRLQRASSTLLDVYVNNQRALRIQSGPPNWIQVSGNLTVTGQLNGGTAWTSANDGSGSGLDADLLDGLDSTGFASASHTHAGEDITSGTVAEKRIAAAIARDSEITPTVWASDGSGSKLDADLLDGHHSTAFAAATHNHDTRYWKLTGNSGTTPGTHFLGTTDNQTLELRVNNARALRLEPNATSPNLIGGHISNTVTSGVVGAVIGGGGSSGNANRVTDDYGTVGGGSGNVAGDGAGTTTDRAYATVGGGAGNTASGYRATVGGGESNTASGDKATVSGGIYNTASGWYATVGGGYDNTAWNNYATVGGGYHNTANGPDATVGGGDSNIASGRAATVPGGANNTASGYRSTVGGGGSNTASGSYSFAAGAGAQATHAGSFVWSSVESTSSWGDNTFTARAYGGVRFYSSFSTGVQLSSGGTSWGSISDRQAKENFAQVDTARLLEALATMPVQTWNLRAQSAAMRHIGPVAQDFNGLFAYLFGEVESPLYINTMDAVGVSLAGIQGLYEHVQQLEAENAALKAANAALETRLTAVEAAIGSGGKAPRPLQAGLVPGAGILLVGLVLGLLVRRETRP